MTQKYETIIGLEIHVQLDTKSKMFSRADNNSEGAQPNTNILPFCLAYPGTLPVINEQAIEYGIIGSLALGCEINEMQRFDRKNYFYPDSPKGYQITQFFHPVGEHGKVKVDYLASDRKTKQEFEVGITRLHLEGDAGKSIHTKDATLVDLNRSGTPLAEIVTEPDIKSPEDARAFLQELQRIVRVVGISKADMEKGHMRIDANISIRPIGQKEFGTKVEVKNINSFKFVEKALKYEVERQTVRLKKGEKIDQETRGWDEKTSTTVSQRGKEGDIDYRYFPEPDLPPIYITKEKIQTIQDRMPALPSLLRKKAEKWKLPYNRIVELQDASDTSLSGYIRLMEDNQSLDAVKVVNTWIKLVALERKENSGAIISDAMWQKAMEQTTQKDSFTTGEDEVKELVEEVLDAEKETVERYKKGEEKLFGYLVGQVMAKTKGSAEPALVQQILKELLTP